MPQSWTNKPDAVIHPEIFINPAFVNAWPIPTGVPINTDRNFCKDLHDFCVANPLPRWQFHPGEPPYPSLKQFYDYFDRGNVFVVCFDQDRMIWSWRINSNRKQVGLWLWVRREEDFLHEPMGDNPYGGLTVHNKEEVPEMEALGWALAGGVQPLQIAGDGRNENVVNLDNDALYQKAIEIYNEKYASG